MLCHAPKAAHLQAHCAPQPRRRAWLRAQHMPHRQRLEPCPAPGAEVNGVHASASATATRDREQPTHSVAASRAGRPPDAPGVCTAAAAMAITSTSARIELCTASTLTNSEWTSHRGTQRSRWRGRGGAETLSHKLARADFWQRARHFLRAAAPQLAGSLYSLYTVSTQRMYRDTVTHQHVSRVPYHPKPARRRWNARSGNRASRRSWSSCERCTSSGSILPIATRQVGCIARAVARRCPSQKYSLVT